MQKTYIVANGILWATAIIASAAFGAPSTLSLILLPCLAVLSLLLALRRSPLSGANQTHWQAYLDGKVSREAAIRQILIETAAAKN